jgi:subtilisin
MSAYFRKFTWLLVAFTIVTCREDDEPVEKPDECLTTSSARMGEIIPGTYIVSFAHTPGLGSRAQTAARTLERHGIGAEKIMDRIDGEITRYVMNLADEQAKRMKDDSGIMLIEPDRILSICACMTVLEPRLVTWNVEEVGYGDGTGKTAWVLDTGIDLDHPDLIVDQDLSRSYIETEPSADDENGHGTHVAGVIGAVNNYIGTLGVASGATLVSLKILDREGNGRVSTALKALSYVKANARAGDVANISLSLETISETLESEIRAVANKGIYVTIAAGNEGKPASSFSPGRANGTNIFTVSAVDSLNNFASFSNYGNEAIDFAAPGVRVVSTYKQGKYAIISGTSMAAPHVAGLLLINNGKVNSGGFALNDPDGTPDPLAHK